MVSKILSCIVKRLVVVCAGDFHGFGSWFEVRFGDIPSEYEYETVTLSTAPNEP